MSAILKNCITLFIGLSASMSGVCVASNQGYDPQAEAVAQLFGLFEAAGLANAASWVNYVETDHNPIVQRIDENEVFWNEIPSAVAYNYVQAILKKDFDLMLALGDPEYNERIIDICKEEFGDDKDKYFKGRFSEGKLGIYQWLPALDNGHEVTVAFIQDESSYKDGSWWCRHPEQELRDGKIYMPGETKPRETNIVKKIYITCSPSAEIGKVGFQDITRFSDTNVKVLVRYDTSDGKWKVLGFK